MYVCVCIYKYYMCIFIQTMEMPRVISDMNISHIITGVERGEQLEIEKLMLKEDFDEAMNKLPIYERAVIKNVLQKIMDANQYDAYELFTEQQKQLKNFIRQQHSCRVLLLEEEGRRANIQVGIGVCVVVFAYAAYVGLAIITR